MDDLITRETVGYQRKGYPVRDGNAYHGGPSDVKYL